MQRAWLREFNSLGLQLRPQAAKQVTNFLQTCDDPHRMCEALVEHTKNYLRSKQGMVAAVIDKDTIDTVISCMYDAAKEAGEAGGGAPQDDAVRIETLHLGDGVYVHDAMTDIRPFDFRRATKEWVPSKEKPSLFPGVDAKAKLYADRYHLLLQRILLEGKLVPEAEFTASGGLLMPGQRILTPVESLVGNPGTKLTFGLLTRLHDDNIRSWTIEDLHKVYPVELKIKDSDHLLTDGSFVLAEGELIDDRFHITGLDVPAAVPRSLTREKDNIPPQAFGGDLSEEQLKTLSAHEASNPDGMYVVLSEVHLDNVRVMDKLDDMFRGYEDYAPPVAYIFMGSFCSSKFVPTAEGVRAYRDGFERLKFMMKGLTNHAQQGTRFVFIPGPNDPGPATLPRTPLPKYLTSDLQDEVPGVTMASNPCRLRHFSREMVFFRHDVLRLLRRHEVVPLRDPETSLAPSPQHVRNEMVRFLLDQAHLVPLPLVESNILWSYDHTLRLYPLPHAVFVGGNGRPFDCKYQESQFCSVGPFCSLGPESRGASFYAFHPVKEELETCDVPDRAG